MRAVAISTAVMAASASGVPRTMPLGVHIVDRPPHSRALQSRGDGHSIPAGGAVFPTAMYWTTIQIGTPPQDYAVGLDSGSGDLFVEGMGCTGCTLDAPNNQYDPAASSTSKAGAGFHHSYKTCNMQNPSATCTMYGTMYTDQVSLAGLGPVTVKVGAINSQTDNFDTKKYIGGLMGLSGFDGEDPLATLKNAGKCDRIWALCMTEGSVSNGTLTIGGVDLRLADGEIAYVPDVGLLYPEVQIKSMMLGTKTIAVGSRVDSAVLDTGTNVLLLPPTLYSSVQSTMCADSSLPHCNEFWSGECFALTENQLSQYPPLSFELDGTSVQMSSKDYLLMASPLATSADQYCLAIRNGGNTGFIIGASTMRNYYLVYDKPQGRVGWGKVNTQTCGSITSDSAFEAQISV